MGRRQVLLAQIERAEAELARLADLPDMSEYPVETVLLVEKQFSPGSRWYTFAALKVAGRWWLTGGRFNTLDDESMAEWLVGTRWWVANEWVEEAV